MRRAVYIERDEVIGRDFAWRGEGVLHRELM
jgi:hypothetical protein